jgi:hypothetical protein
MNFINTCDASWLLGHLELAGFDLMKGIPNQHGMESNIFSRFEKVLTGHFHTKSTKGNITYLGAQMEFTWADVNDQKYFHVVDTDTRKLIPVKNPITIFEKIVYNDKEIDYNVDYDLVNLDHKYVKIVVAQKSDAYAFDKFVSKVQNQAIHDLKIVESFDEFLGDNVKLDDAVKVEDTQQLLENYIENVDTDLEKDKLKDLMKSIYIEALNTEIV